MGPNGGSGWLRTQDRCNWCWQSNALTTRLDLIRTRLDHFIVFSLGQFRSSWFHLVSRLHAAICSRNYPNYSDHKFHLLPPNLVQLFPSLSNKLYLVQKASIFISLVPSSSSCFYIVPDDSSSSKTVTSTISCVLCIITILVRSVETEIICTRQWFNYDWFISKDIGAFLT